MRSFLLFLQLFFISILTYLSACAILTARNEDQVPQARRLWRDLLAARQSETSQARTTSLPPADVEIDTRLCLQKDR